MSRAIARCRSPTYSCGMDATKLVVLREIGYQIPAHCGICQHADLSADGWGYCNRHSYVHQKHSEASSRLSIHRQGSCQQHVLDEGALAALGLHGFAEFVRSRLSETP